MTDKQEKKDSMSDSHPTWLIGVLAFLITIVHFGQFGGRPVPIIYMAYFILAIIATFIYKELSEPVNFTRLGFFMLVSAVAVFYPWGISELVSRFGSAQAQQFLGPALGIAAPVWWIYLAAHPRDKYTRWFAIIFWIGWLLYIFVLFVLPILPSVTGAPQVYWTFSDIRAGAVQFWHTVRDTTTQGGTSTVKTVKDFFSGQVTAVTQEYYTGTVDSSNSGPPVGVFITDGRPFFTTFDVARDDISVSATMKVHTFSDNVTVKNTCGLEVLDTSSFSSLKPPPIEGVMTPEELRIDYTGEFQERFALDCVIKNTDYATKLPAGRMLTGNVVFNTSFGFETWAYAEYGFMQRELVLAFLNENLDPASELGVPRTVLAKYTPGPVMIGMPTETQPFRFDATSGAPNQIPSFGMTFSNAWEGKGRIVSFSLVRAYLPKQFKLVTDQCLPSNYLGKPVERTWEENEQYNYYEFTDVKLPPGESFITIKCPVKVASSDNKGILGTAGAGKFTWFAQAVYDYELGTKVPVTIKREPKVPESTDQCKEGTQNCDSTSKWCTCLVIESATRYTWECGWYIGKEGERVCEPNYLN